MRRVLFMAEAVTLAHAARPYVLAKALDPAHYQVVVAQSPHYDHLFPPADFERRDLASIPPETFLKALAAGRPLYDAATLERYIEADLALIKEVAPDLIVGDFRLSLSVSARLAGVPYATLTNIYWSPYARQHYPIPSHPLVRLTGVPVAQALFRAVRPMVAAVHSRPLNRVRRRFGLTPLKPTFQAIYTDADTVFYADLPGLVETLPLPSNHAYLGPILWSPVMPLPDWWDTLPEDRPIVYVNLGSSGNSKLLPDMLKSLADLPVTVIAATLGKLPGLRRFRNSYLADFLPGEDAAGRSRLVVCNGGSPAAYQALSAGVPAIGLPSNLDQFLNMQAVSGTGAGRSLRADGFNPAQFQKLVTEVLGDNHSFQKAKLLREKIRATPAEESFTAWMGN